MIIGYLVGSVLPFSLLLLAWNVYTLWDGDLANDGTNFQVTPLFLIRFEQVSVVSGISYDMFI